MMMRQSQAGKYRFGFNGKENDNEVKGLGNQQDYGMRIYDPRIGRFLSKDPLYRSFPWWTPYQFSGNMPIRFIDLDGLEPAEPGTEKGEIRKARYTYGEKNGFDGNWYWDGNEWSPIMNEVTVTGKKENLGQKIWSAVQDGIGNSTAYVLGAANAWASNNLNGWSRGNPESWGNYATAAKMGQSAGDFASLITSSAEVTAGVVAQFPAAALDVGGVTAPAGVAVHAWGAAAVTHGALTFGNAWRNLMSNLEQAASANDGNNDFDGITRKEIGEAQWSSPEVSKAAKDLDAGGTDITVKNKSQVEELFFRLFQGKGYKNTTGLTGKQVRTDKFLYPQGKKGTYHWDFNDTQHGGVPHLQIHDFDGRVIRIFWNN